MKRTFVAVALAVVFVMALAAPAFAQMTHTAAYEFDGVIDFEKQAGHKCNTGAAIMQTIKGSGVMDKTQTVSMNTGKISMTDDNNWVAGATALTVTTVWELCAPPKYVYTDDSYGGDLENIAVPVWGMYNGDLAQLVDDGDVEALTDQIWAVQVQADPGFSGNLSQNGEAAYGPYGGDPWDEEDDTWGWDLNDDLVNVIKRGDDYVGNYFNMDLHARPSMGTVRRYIDLSSPFSHAYVMEDMSVVGKSDIKDVLAMMNIKAGADLPGDWWSDLF